MADQYLGEIRVFAGDFAPQGWALCNGQLMSISQNTALYSILGTSFGGDGTTNFALPNLSGSVPMHWGQGPGLTPRELGQSVGAPEVTLTTATMPSHSHQAMALAASGQTKLSTGSVFAEDPSAGPHQPGQPLYTSSANTAMSGAALASAGGGQPHNNMQPYLGLTFIIALEGEYPSRS